MSDESEYSFEYEDETSLESDENFDSDSQPCDAFSGLSSQVQSMSISPTKVNNDETQRWMKSPNLLSNILYRPLSVSWYVYEHMIEPAQKLRRDFLPQFSLEEVILLLHYKKWSVDEVTSEFYSDWPRLRDACGLTETREAHNEIRQLNDFSCSICCESGNLSVFALSCRHEYCASCYKRYVASALAKGLLIRCISTECQLALSYNNISQLLDVEIEPEDEPETANFSSSDLINDAGPIDQQESADDDDSQDVDPEDSFAKDSVDEYDAQFEDMDLEKNDPVLAVREPLSSHPLLVYAARSAIDTSHSKYRWCPAIDCEQLVEIFAEPSPSSTAEAKDGSNDLSAVAIVVCGSNHQFCFTCHYENHLPCPCWLTKAWIKRCEDDSETVNWIDANTQGCPKCSAVIEKNGGCNHMTCEKCKNEFCWICLGEWALHKTSYFQCNRYDPKEVEDLKKKQSEKQNSLSRYLHFYRRFSVHQISMNGDKNTLKSVRQCMLQYMKAQTLSVERTSSWNDVQFLSDAIRSLFNGRKTLMWTYVFAFYLKKSNFSVIFEGMQDFLNKTVEDLSSIFEEIKVVDSPEKTAARITKRRSEIMSLASLVMRRRNMLIESAHTGLRDQTLQFFSP